MRRHGSAAILVLALCSALILADEDYSPARGGSDRYQDEAETGELDVPVSAGSGCPSECHCNRAAQIADCSNRNLLKVPSSFPRDIKRIRLERNNITELGPYAFKGLKRLQRIDLSNNNLLRIDPLAFAGNLQSLNSLILYSNKLSQLPANLFNGLNQLQLLLLNNNNLKCVSKQLFGSLSNLNLLSLYDNNIETLTNGTFDGLRNIKTIHLGKNPLACDCNLRWLADYLELNPIETSEARCEKPAKNQGKKLGQLSKQKFRCEGNEETRLSQCEPQPAEDQSCPAGCQCDGSTIDCSRASQSESRAGPTSAGLYELPELPDDVPVFVTRVKFNDNRIKRIRQTGLFRRLANSRKLDLGSGKILDIEDNYINAGSAGQSSAGASGSAPSARPERVVVILMENDLCDASAPKSPALDEYKIEPGELLGRPAASPCSLAAKVNPPAFDSPCYNGGSCVTSGSNGPALNFSCLCPPGFAGPLCETNLDDCIDHQCQNGAACIDGVNSYRCVCRDPTTSGEFCEQLNPSLTLAPLNSISSAPVAMPIVSAAQELVPANQRRDQSQILARSADSINAPLIDLVTGPQQSKLGSCKRVTRKSHIVDGDCRSVRALKLSSCESSDSSCSQGCCLPAKTKQRRVRMLCNDGASYVKVVELVKKCACSNQCSAGQEVQQLPRSQYNQESGAPRDSTASNITSQEDQVLQTTRLDAMD